MKVYLRYLIIVLLMLTWEGISKANPISLEATGAELKVSYEEPSTNIDGSALTDLAKTTIYYDKGAGAVKAIDIAATKETGGGSIVTTFTIPMKENEEADIAVWATAIDKSGNESDKSNIVEIRLDFLKPAPPD